MDPKTQVCIRCGVEKDLWDFVLIKRTGKVTAACKKCLAEANEKAENRIINKNLGNTHLDSWHLWHRKKRKK